MAFGDQFANQVGAGNVYTGPLFSEILPYEKAWEMMLPAIQQEAAVVVNPFIDRDLKSAARSYMTDLAGGGGGRFGRGLGGVGHIFAQSEQQRKAQMEDFINAREQGFETGIYNPTEEAWTRAIELGQSKKAQKMATYDELAKRFGIDKKATYTEPQRSYSIFGGLTEQLPSLYKSREGEPGARIQPYPISKPLDPMNRVGTPGSRALPYIS
jgi:hypothetical protein